MVIDYSFNCSWDFDKKDRITSLILERVLLLCGHRVFDKIASLKFCEKTWIYDNLSINRHLLYRMTPVTYYINETGVTDIYEVVLDKCILLSMLNPGTGQSNFDNLILELRNTIEKVY